ncbi:MAG: NTP/NDP exchange transporter [Verrucomicrobia bacterium]|nr:NTP/NDP exchange transporter [Verrucomicrobiota bacterium]
MQEFRGLRAWFFPIHLHELKKFLPLSLMMFFVVFNYQILRDTKDTLIVYAAGAKALSLIKLIGTVPGALLVVLIYSKLSTFCTRQQLFYAVLGPFLLFFGLFGTCIYPNRELLHPSSEWVESLSSLYPRWSTLFSVCGCWSYALFFVLAELWGSVILSLLFWQLANDIATLKEAKRFYPLFGLLANFAPVLAGLTTTFFSQAQSHSLNGADPWGTTLNYLMGLVLLSGMAIIYIHRWIFRTHNVSATIVHDKTKTKPSLKESFLFLSKSKHLGYIALIVICYGISENVIEGLWHEQLRSIYATQNDYSAFMGRVSMITGFTTVAFMIIGTNIVRLCGWYFSASLTPLVIASTGLFFFTLVTFKTELESSIFTLFGITPTLLAAWVGFFQIVVTKSIKYSLVDSTKEMCYIPLDPESKSKGKAAVEIVGGRLGKSGGAFFQQMFLFITAGSLTSVAPYLAIVCLSVCVVWLLAVGKLDLSLQSYETHEPAPLPVEKQSNNQGIA